MRRCQAELGRSRSAEMGVWATGLYSGDFAKDLSSAARAVAQLPLDGERVAELLYSVEPGAANNTSDEDHTTFWLVVADQFAKRGIVCERVRKKALETIDEGEDLAMQQRLGLNAAGLKKRGKMLAELREKIVSATTPAKPRRVLKRPQALVMNTGDVVVYPTARGNTINPYFPSVEKMRPEWIQDGWGAAVIVETGREFDFLARYRPLTIANPMSGKLGFKEVLANEIWVMRLPGTCSASHLRKMRLEKIGSVAVDAKKVKRCFPKEPTGRSAAVNDISIANRFSVGPALRREQIHVGGEPQNNKWGRQHEGIRRLEEILGQLPKDPV
jgi:hypothetical protein